MGLHSGWVVRLGLACALLSADATAGEKKLGQSSWPRLPAPAKDSDYYDSGRPSADKVTLGKFLFFDKILSGNQNISCATCHHPLTDTGDGLSLPVGEGGRGLGVTRDCGTGLDAITERVPRNAPHIFNLGAREFRRMFYDGRVEVDLESDSGMRTPAGEDLPAGLDNILAAQAMFPVTSPTEMAGDTGENTIADASSVGDLPAIWDQLAERLRAIPEYLGLFGAAYPGQVFAPKDITYVLAANAIAAFEASAWRADDSPFDRYLRGDRQAMSGSARLGMQLFYGRAGCSGCHRGIFQTDHEFHAIAMPQIGPGKGDGNDSHEDLGRERVTGRFEDRHCFRTPSLRNVALTGPWGHAGAFNSLEAVVLHHFSPEESLENYDTAQAVLPFREDLAAIDFVVHNDPFRRNLLAASNELSPIALSSREFGQLMDFLHALTDSGSLDLRRDVPATVPSGLTVYE